MPSSLSFGALLEQHLKRLHISYREFALRAGVSHTFINRIIVGSSRPMGKRFGPWADLLGLEGEARAEFLRAGWMLHTPKEFHEIITAETLRQPETKVAEPSTDEPPAPIRRRKKRKSRHHRP